MKGCHSNKQSLHLSDLTASVTTNIFQASELTGNTNIFLSTEVIGVKKCMSHTYTYLVFYTIVVVKVVLLVILGRSYGALCMGNKVVLTASCCVWKVVGDLMLRIQRIPDFTPKLLLVRKRLLGLEPEGIKYVLFFFAGVPCDLRLLWCRFNSRVLLVALTTWLCWRGWSCWRSSARSWQPSPSSSTTLWPLPRLNLPCSPSHCPGQAQVSIKLWRCWWHRVGKPLPLTGRPWKTVNAHMGGFYHFLPVGLHRDKRRHCPANRG